jgi:NitT/TauT family transport system substrate-binding protein
MNRMQKAVRKWLAGLAVFTALAVTLQAGPLKLGYSDWPGWTILEVANQKGWFKEAGVDTELVWFDYSASLDAFSAGKIDGVTVVPTDAMVLGASGNKSKLIAITDYSDGNDKVIGEPGVDSIAALKGKKVAVELTLVDHLLLLQALKANGMAQSDVVLVNTPTNNTPQVLASKQVAAIAAWYPVAGQALKQVAGSKPLFTSHEAPGLIYDVIAVNPTSYAQHKEDWTKVVKVFYRCVDYLQNPATHDDAVKIMAARVGADPVEYAKNLPGTHFMTVREAKKAFVKGPDLDSIYGSMENGNKFNLDNKVYPQSQNPASYLAPTITNEM